MGIMNEVEMNAVHCDNNEKRDMLSFALLEISRQGSTQEWHALCVRDENKCYSFFLQKKQNKKTS